MDNMIRNVDAAEKTIEDVCFKCEKSMDGETCYIKNADGTDKKSVHIRCIRIETDPVILISHVALSLNYMLREVNKDSVREKIKGNIERLEKAISILKDNR